MLTRQDFDVIENQTGSFNKEAIQKHYHIFNIFI